MSHGRNKYQSRENRARIREIFMRDWDPIGVAGVDEAADEYDAYVARAYVMLMDDRATAEQIASYLVEVATGHMGLSNRAEIVERSNSVAATLVGLRSEFETH